MPVSEEKEIYEARMNRLLDTFSKVLFCRLDNVRSCQMHSIRLALRGKGEVLVGKKTLQKKIINKRAANGSATDKALAKVLCEEEKLSGNLGLVFTNDDVADITKILTSFRVQAPARVGAISPVDVVVPAGNTGLEPTTTGFFQALNIPTKISKGTVEIVADKKVLGVGDKVDNSVAQLLTKLNISPFFYSAEVEFYWDNGLIFSAEDLKVTGSQMKDNITTAIANLTAVSLATGILTEASFPHAILDGFKTLLGASVESNYVFKEFNGEKLRNDIKSGKATGPAAAAPAGGKPAAAAPAAKAAAPPPEEEDDDVGLGGLF